MEPAAPRRLPRGATRAHAAGAACASVLRPCEALGPRGGQLGPQRRSARDSPRVAALVSGCSSARPVLLRGAIVGSPSPRAALEWGGGAGSQGARGVVGGSQVGSQVGGSRVLDTRA